MVKKPIGSTDGKTFDINRKFVRVMRELPNGLIEFEFAVGDPDVAAELVMPKDAFEEFCRTNQVEVLTGAKSQNADSESAEADFNWSLHQATHQRFK